MSKLNIAIQKSGRLHDQSIAMLKDCGLQLENGRGQLKVNVGNFPVELFFLRNSDIPQYVQDGVVDVAIVGENLIIESQKSVEAVLPLGFSQCRLSLAIPKDINYADVSYFQGKRIATSYPNTLKIFLAENNIQADIHVISGSVEIAPNIGLSDGICDLVSTGSTLYKNGLQEVAVIINSEAKLIKSPQLTEAKQAILNALVFRLEAVLRSKKKKYILMNVPNTKIAAVSSILPVLRSPTILPLADPGWSSLHSVIDESKFWNVIHQLKAAGAEGILIIPIDKMVL